MTNCVADPYIKLKEKSRYLHEITLHGKRELSDKEISTAEDEATTWLIGALGKKYIAGNLPPIIEGVADKYASHICWLFVHAGQTIEDSAYAQKLLDDAKETVRQIRVNELGVVFCDGSFDPDYPGPSESVEANTDDDEFDIIT